MKNVIRQEEFIDHVKKPTDKTRSSLTGHIFQIMDSHGQMKYEVEVGRLVGTGASSMVYEVVVDDGYPPKKNMIMKEFFPSFAGKEMHGMRDIENPLKISYITSKEDELDLLAGERGKFIDAYKKHIEIIEIDPVLQDKIVKPYKLESCNDYIFAIYETDNATSVDKYLNLGIVKIISILRQASEILSFLHTKDIIYMDLKPANILYDYSRDRVKLFDFDAAIFLDDLDATSEFYMPNERAFIPPELRFISSIDKRKEMFITEEIDLYMLGVTFFYLIMDRYPTDAENEDMEYLERNIREVLMKKSNRIFLNPEVKEQIVDLIKESISVHRYISVEEFSQRLDRIETSLDLENNKAISNILSIAYFMDAHPLYEYIREDGGGKYIDIAILGDMKRGMEFFSFLYAAVDLEGVELRFNIYHKNPKEGYTRLIEAMPMIGQTTFISVNGKLVDGDIDPEITDHSYGKIHFKKVNQEINDHYIIIIHEPGVNYDDRAMALFEKFKDSDEKRAILNHSRYARANKTLTEKSTNLYTIDLHSAAAFRNKDYNDSILNEAYETHKFYTRAYGGERVDDRIIWQEFLGNNLYNLKSSIRAALSMRYRIYMSDSYKKDDIARDFYEKVVRPGRESDGLSLRDIFADMEHHAWNRFMISQGYRRPTDEEFSKYAFVGSNNHIDKVNKLHPLIVNSNIRKFKSGQDDEFEIVCKKIYEHLLEKIHQSEKRVLDRIANSLNNTSWYANDNLRELLPLWEELYNVSNRMISKEAFSINTVNQLTGIMDERFESDFHGREELYTDYISIKNDLSLFFQRDKQPSFRYSDYMIIDAKPLIKSGTVNTIFKPFVAGDDILWANVLAAIKFDPKKLILISDEKDIYEDKLKQIISFMQDMRLQKSLIIEMVSYEEMAFYNKEDAIVDLTLNKHKDTRRREFTQLPFVEYLGSNQWAGDFKAKDYFFTSRNMTVEETFFLNNAHFYNAASENNLARLSNYYEKLWENYLKYPSYQWKDFIDLFKTSRSKYILNLSYPECEKTSMYEVGDFTFRRDAKLKYPKLVSFLNDLKTEGIVTDYQFPINPGKLKLHTINDYLTFELGDFISKSLQNHYSVFDLRKLYSPLLDEEAGRKLYSYGMNNNLYFSYKAKHKNPSSTAYELNKLMENLDEDVDREREIRIFNQIGDRPYVRALDQELEFNYELGDIAFREFFEKGIALKIFTYFELIRKSTVFDEIKIDVGLKWRAYGDYSPISEGVENTLDIVCTRGFSTFIISCVQDELSKDLIYETSNHSKQFGIDTTSILVSSYSEGLDPAIQKIAQATGVYLIDRDMILENGLVAYLENIARVKEDWQIVD